MSLKKFAKIFFIIFLFLIIFLISLKYFKSKEIPDVENKKEDNKSESVTKINLKKTDKKLN